MQFLVDLWLPIVLSAAFVFVASSVIHMMTPMHKGDWRKLPGEDAVGEALRAQGIKPGDYTMPRPESMKEMGTPEMIARFEKGPVVFMTVRPNGPPTMGAALIQWFLLTLLISLFVGYVAWHGIGQGTIAYLSVFRFTGTVAVLGYAFASFPESIWKGLSWGTTIRFMIDGIIYGLVTAGTFAWLWPGRI